LLVQDWRSFERKFQNDLKELQGICGTRKKNQKKLALLNKKDELIQFTTFGNTEMPAHSDEVVNPPAFRS